jgi:hypothetical protein
MSPADEQAIRGLANEILRVSTKWLDSDDPTATSQMILIEHDAKAIIERLGEQP